LSPNGYSGEDGCLKLRISALCLFASEQGNPFYSEWKLSAAY